MNNCRHHPLRIYWKVKKNQTIKILQIKNCDNPVEQILALYNWMACCVHTNLDTLHPERCIFQNWFHLLEPDKCVCVQICELLWHLVLSNFPHKITLYRLRILWYSLPFTYHIVFILLGSTCFCFFLSAKGEKFFFSFVDHISLF